MTDRQTMALVLIAAPALVGGLLWCLPRRWVAPAAVTGAVITGTLAVTVAATALTDPGHPQAGTWVALDAAGGLLVGVVGVVGMVSVLASPAYLATAGDPAAGHGRRQRTYFAVLYAFWALLLAVPVAGNLGAAWLLVEATTAASALLVGFSGKARALEAGWKYLILTSLGLGIALFGVALVAAGVPGGGLGMLSWGVLSTYGAGPQTALVAYLLLVAGLAAKIGLAPVHNWLPDAHSEAPAPVSAMLSAALLPAVLLVAWRCEQGLAPVIRPGAAQAVLIGFGLVSIAVAVPFLSRPLAWKRLLAYSSLEHMGVITLGIGFATPLAMAGVAIHIVGHAIAKTLGFCAVTPLLAHEPGAAGHPVTGIARTQPALGATVALSLGTLSGLPPSPLFVSELLVISGGFQSGRPWVAATAALLLALAFIGLVRALLEATLGESAGRARRLDPRGTPRLAGLRGLTVLTAAALVLLLILGGASVWLPASDLVQALLKGVG
ncbi:MAG TPA: proton-conducting transporter membrane subunit [Micromonosporaceae bacterium]|nr:proton-conducting transporter membrane subunit [Micromonosporaceae bacterium]